MPFAIAPPNNNIIPNDNTTAITIYICPGVKITPVPGTSPAVINNTTAFSAESLSHSHISTANTAQKRLNLAAFLLLMAHFQLLKNLFHHNIAKHAILLE
jgi:hypothetical protein